MEQSTRPDFVGSQWLMPGQGFAYESTPPDNLAAHVDDDNEWMRLLATFEQMKKGKLEHDVSLFKLVSRSGNPEIRFLGLTLLRHVASQTCRLGIAQFFDHQDVDTRMAAYDAALYSSDLRLIDPLLRKHRHSKGDERFVIMHAISHLLETEPGKLYDDMSELSPDEYERLTRATMRDVETRCGKGPAVFESRLLSLAYVIERIETLCGSDDAVEYSGAISTYFDLFEAMSGYSCVGVFDDDVMVDPHYAMELVDEFQETRKVGAFLPGQRYFFGHKLLS